jgi:phasin family protein
MANPRQEEKSTQAAEEATRRVGERTAEQIGRVGETTSRVGETAVETGQEVARVGADLMRQNTETLQNAVRFYLEMTRAVMGRSTDQVGRAFGLSGDEVQRAAEKSARNTATVLQSSTAMAKGMTGVSQEYFAFLRQQIESSMDRMNELWRCRTPQDIVAVQSDFVREAMECAVQSSRRMADMSLKAADDSAKRMAQTIDRHAA